jgi:hypothetical protein
MKTQEKPQKRPKNDFRQRPSKPVSQNDQKRQNIDPKSTISKIWTRFRQNP